MARQEDSTKLLALALLNYADDSGFFYADPAMVRAALRPLDEDLTIVRRGLAALSNIGFIDIVEHPTHGPIGKVVSFRAHQSIDRPKESKLNGLWNSSKPRRSIDDSSLLEQGTGIREQGSGSAEPGEDESPEPEEPASGPAEKPILVFDCVGFVKAWTLSEEKLQEWQSVFPDLDVLAALRRARQWCIDNPTKRKTAAGMPRFLNSWLGTAQDNGESRKGKGQGRKGDGDRAPVPIPRLPTSAELDREEDRRFEEMAANLLRGTEPTFTAPRAKAAQAAAW